MYVCVYVCERQRERERERERETVTQPGGSAYFSGKLPHYTGKCLLPHLTVYYCEEVYRTKLQFLLLVIIRG